MFKKIVRILSNYYVTTFFRLALGGIFIFTGLLKLTEPKEEFIEILHKFDLLPEILVVPFATVLPWVELLSGCLTVLSIWTSVGLVIICGQLLMFIGAISINLLRGVDIAECGCFGFLKIFGENSWEVLSRDFPMLGVGLWLLYLQSIKENWLKLFLQIKNKLSQSL